MKLVAEDFRKVQGSVLAALSVMALAAVVLYVSHNARENAQLSKTAVVAQRDEADGKLKRVRDEESEIKQKSNLFNKLVERGIIGDEQRLDWVELLKDIREKRRLVDVRYDISPQRLLDGSSATDFAFFASAMKLQVKLLHEEDLTRLLADLDQQAKALIRVNNCKVERLPPATDERAAGRANLLADCEIDWLTVHETGRR